MNGEENHHSQIPHVQLFVKRSIMDNSHKSSCPICQRWFMVLFLKSEAKELALTVFPVNMRNPEPEFKEYHAQPPVVVLVQENVVLTDNLRIEQYINSRFTSLDLNSDREAESICSDLYIKLNAYLKANDSTVQSKERLLLMELQRLNDFLEQRGTTFLSGNEMTLIDCDVMPKLQHIRIAGKAYRNFEIPAELDSLWKYMSACYDTKAFKESCPYDQDIILHYEGKVPLKPLGKNPTLQRASTTMTVPDLPINN